MSRETAQFYALLTANPIRDGMRAGVLVLALYCDDCGRDRLHTFTTGPVWTTVACTVCKRAADYREG